jgi:outer membrane protein
MTHFSKNINPSLLALVLLILASQSAFAQKFAYVDSQYILENIPEYKLAQDQLNALSSQWQKEIEAKFKELEEMKEAYRMEKILLTPEMKMDREAKIKEKEDEVRKLQQQRFGPTGDLFKKRQELVKPVQDRVFNAISEFASRGKYGIIFDRSSDLIMLFADPSLDKSEDILRALGY